MPRDAGVNQALCANMNGFSPHAAVRCAAEDRKSLEELCRYITRPALADERVQCNAAAQMVLKLKTPWHDGTTYLVLSPLEFMQRLAARVPRPRLHLIRCHGVLAPQRQDARAGGATRSGRARRRSERGVVRGELCTLQAGADELGPAARTGLRDRPRTLPQLRRRAEDHRCDPGGAGDRAHPHPSGSTGPCATAGASGWAGPASGLIETRPIAVRAAPRPGPREPAASGTF